MMKFGLKYKITREADLFFYELLCFLPCCVKDRIIAFYIDGGVGATLYLDVELICCIRGLKSSFVIG